MLISFIAGLIIGGFLIFLIVRTKLKRHLKLNQEIAEQNKKIEEENKCLLNTQQIYIQENKELALSKQNYQEQIKILQDSQQSHMTNLAQLEQQAQDAAVVFYNDKMKLATEQINSSLEKLKINYENAEKEYQQHYLELLKDFTTAYKETTSRQKEELAIAETILLDLQSKVDAAVEANKRAELERNEKDFYKLILTEEDVKEIKHLRSVVPYLRNAETLNKVIWKAYYEKPYTDLIGRVVGSHIKTGIYKITNLDNGMCYVGQAVKLAGEKLFLVAARGCGIPKFLTNN